MKKIIEKIDKAMMKLFVKKQRGLKGTSEEMYWVIVVLVALLILKDPLIATLKTVLTAISTKANTLMNGI